MKRKLFTLICIILLASNLFGCTKIDDKKQTDLISYNNEVLYMQAEALTKHILSNVLKITHVNNNEKIIFTNRDIFDFVVTLFIYREDLNHPYNDITEIRIDNGAFAIYKLEDMQRAVEELFGVQDWFDTSLEDFYDKDSNKVVLSIEQGMPGGYFTYEDIKINSLANTNYIEVKFELNRFDPYEEEKAPVNYGVYKIIFEVISENSRSFLRLHSIESVK